MRRLLSTLAVLGLLPVALAGANDGDDVVATVFGDPITHREVERRLAAVREGLLFQVLESHDIAGAEDRWRTGLAMRIDEKMLAHTAEKLGVDASESAIDESIRRTPLYRRFGTLHGVYQVLEESGIRRSEFRDWHREQVRIRRYLRYMLPDDPVVTPREMRAYHEEHEADFAAYERLELDMIQIPIERFPSAVAALGHARDLLDRMADPTSPVPFERIAGEEGGAFADRGGRWPVQSSSDFHPAVAEAAARLETGRISAPIETPSHVFLIRVRGRSGRRVLSFEEAQEQIVHQLRARKMADAEHRLLDRLRRDTPIWTP